MIQAILLTAFLLQWFLNFRLCILLAFFFKQFILFLFQKLSSWVLKFCKLKFVKFWLALLIHWRPLHKRVQFYQDWVAIKSSILAYQAVYEHFSFQIFNSDKGYEAIVVFNTKFAFKIFSLFQAFFYQLRRKLFLLQVTFILIFLSTLFVLSALLCQDFFCTMLFSALALFPKLITDIFLYVGIEFIWFFP